MNKTIQVQELRYVASRTKFSKNERKRLRQLETLAKLTWRAFSQTTSIHGLLYIFGKTNLRAKGRLVWSLIFGICLSLCLWQCMQRVKIYSEYNLKVTTRYNFFKTYNTSYSIGSTSWIPINRPFPQIQFCNQHTWRKSEIGKSDYRRLAMALLNTRNLPDAQHMAKQSKAVCDISGEKLAYDDYEEEIDNTENNLKNWQMNSATSVKKCWFTFTGLKRVKREWDDCNNFFTNYGCFDLTECFNFNAHQFRGLNKYLQDLNEESKQNIITISKYDPYTTFLSQKFIGPTFGGFKALLTVNQSEHCSLINKWHGAGYKVRAMGSAEGRCTGEDTYTLLAPGYFYNIGITQTTTYRKTKRLGLCTDDAYLTYSSNSDVFLDRDCYNDCLLKIVWSTCKCIPPALFDEKEAIAELLGMILTDDITSCSVTIEKIQCAVSTPRRLKDEPFSDICPECKTHCHEDIYKLQISAVKLSRLQLNALKFDFGTNNLTSIRKNFLLVNIYYPDLDYVYVEEEQEMAIYSLFINYIGKVIILFLGMSFMSPFEILFQCVIYVHTKLIQNLFKNIVSNRGGSAAPTAIHSRPQAAVDDGFMNSPVIYVNEFV